MTRYKFVHELLLVLGAAPLITHAQSADLCADLATLKIGAPTGLSNLAIAQWIPVNYNQRRS